MNMLNLKNKTALITGGGTGIGRSIALHLAQEGCNLVLTGLDLNDLEAAKAECEKYNVRAYATETQLDDYASIDRLYEFVISNHLSIDIFVLNAGISQREKALNTDISVDEKILKIDFLSGVYLVKKFKEPLPYQGFSASRCARHIARPNMPCSGFTNPWNWNMTTSESLSSSQDASTRKSARVRSTATALPTPKWMPAKPTASMWTNAAKLPSEPSNGKNTEN